MFALTDEEQDAPDKQDPTDDPPDHCPDQPQLGVMWRGHHRGRIDCEDEDFYYFILLKKASSGFPGVSGTQGT